MDEIVVNLMGFWDNFPQKRVSCEENLLGDDDDMICMRMVLTEG